MAEQRRLPIGADLHPGGGASFRVWAPRCKRVDVVVGTNRDVVVPLEPEGDGYFSGQAKQAVADEVYWYRLDGKGTFPDPASRFQPEGPHGPSQIIDPNAFSWSDAEWKGVALLGQVIYEMHIGTFTPAGTWAAAIAELPVLADLGITVVEVMPVADFPGKFGWGYDGVNLYAPTRLYGMPDDFRRFVDEAHRLGMGVILDVVYNHIGPDGNYLLEYSPHYFSARYLNEWGDAINFDDEHAGPVREYFAGNAGYWIDEFHLDGLRLDATQQIFDSSEKHILTEVKDRVRAAARGRATVIFAENEAQHSQMARQVENGGYGLDGLWNDDFHHSARVALTGHSDAYYTDYSGTPQELLSAIKWGYLFQGQRYKWQKARRGRPALDLAPAQFVTFIQNHDQIANSGTGERIHKLTSMARYRAMTALLLLAPGTPLLFQGQEFAASSPFLFFADHNPELAKLVSQGRAKFLEQFPRLALPEAQARLADPADPKTFERCKLDLSEREKHADIYRLHRDLLRLRREDPAFRAQKPRGVDGAVLGERVLLLRYFAEGNADRILVVNFGSDLQLDRVPEPLLAPPEGMRWEILWSSEDLSYGGGGTVPLETENCWRIPGETTVALQGVAAPQEHRKSADSR